jgi:hypothetical protein
VLCSLALVTTAGCKSAKEKREDREKAEQALKEGLLMVLLKPSIDQAKATVAQGGDPHNDCMKIDGANRVEMSKWTSTDGKALYRAYLTACEGDGPANRMLSELKKRAETVKQDRATNDRMLNADLVLLKSACDAQRQKLYTDNFDKYDLNGLPSVKAYRAAFGEECTPASLAPAAPAKATSATASAKKK